MSEIQVKNLQNSCDLLTMKETSLIIGGAGNVNIKESFNDTLSGNNLGDGSVIITDPLRVEGLYSFEEGFGVSPEFLDKI